MAHKPGHNSPTSSPTPTPTPTEGSTTVVAAPNAGLINLGDYGAITDPLSWKAASKTKMRLDGLFPGKLVMTGEETFIALQKLSRSDPARWGSIRALLVAMHAYSGSKIPDFNANWTNADEYAIKNALTQFHIANIPNPTDPKIPGEFTVFSPNAQTEIDKIKAEPKSFLAFAQDYAISMKNNGYTPRAVKKYTVPATADLTTIAQDAATKSLGRALPPAEAAQFAKDYQALVMSYQKGQNNKSLQTAFSAPTNESVGLPGKTPSAGGAAGAVMQAPDVGVAATNFALKANPAQAAATGLDNAMSSWFESLAKGAGK